MSDSTSADPVSGTPASGCSHSPMPIFGGWDRVGWKPIPAFSVPWEMLEAHDEQAKRNHAGQDLQRLFERHGLSDCEALAILDDRSHRSMDPAVAREELARRVNAFNANTELERQEPSK